MMFEDEKECGYEHETENKPVIRCSLEYTFNDDGTLSVRLLEFHADYAEMFADALISKCVGDDEAAVAKYEVMREKCGARELEFERWYDHAAGFMYFDKWFRASTKKGAADRDFEE